MISKKEAREQVRKIRTAMSAEECYNIARKVTEKLITLKKFGEAEVVYLYNPIRNEMPTVYIAEKAVTQGKITAYPKVEGEDMRFYIIDDGEDVAYGYMNIKEPVASPERLVDIDKGIVILPGLAFDRKCNRAGYGKGFYDRFLEGHKNLVKIGIAYDFQVFDELETDIWDIPLDYVITETTIYKG